MPALSELFRRQAASDLALAQLISGRDQSGHALGVAMFLAQQCFEKQLKSMVLGLSEAMGLEDDARFLGRLSHEFYPRLHEFREKHVKGIDLPVGLLKLMELESTEQAFWDNAQIIKRLGEMWGKYSKPGCTVREYAWKNYLHVALPRGELDELNGFIFANLESWSRDVGRPYDRISPPVPPFSNTFEPCPAMAPLLRDEAGLAALREDYARSLLQTRALVEEHMSVPAMMFSALAGGHIGGLTADEQGRAAMRPVLEFGFGALAMHAYRYMWLYPNNIWGRYPAELSGGQTTVGVYESQSNVVLHQLHVEIPYYSAQVCEQASKMDALCEAGRGLGYW